MSENMNNEKFEDINAENKEAVSSPELTAPAPQTAAEETIQTLEQHAEEMQKTYAETEPERPAPELTLKAEPAPAAPAAPAEEKKEKKTHPVLIWALSGLIGLAGGFGGGYLAASTFAKNAEPTIIYQEPEKQSEDETPVTPIPQAVTSSGLSIKEIAAKAAPSVVEIVVEAETQSYGFWGGTYIAKGAGSGVILSSDGYIITNNHVVENAQSITVTTYDGKEYPATLVGTDKKMDIGVIKIDASGLTPAVIGDSSVLEVGDLTVVIGNPLGTLGGTVTNGIVSATNREIVIDNEAMNLIQTNAAINNGNSGGGMFDAYGNLIGIVNAKDSGLTNSGATIDGLGFAIPINDAMDVAQELIEYGTVTNRPMIGVNLSTLSYDRGQYKAGLYIADVMSGYGAEKAGLQAYDRIVKADGTDIATYTDLSRIMRSKKIGDTIVLTIERDGKTFDVTVDLIEHTEDTIQG